MQNQIKILDDEHVEAELALLKARNSAAEPQEIVRLTEAAKELARQYVEEMEKGGFIGT